MRIDFSKIDRKDFRVERRETIAGPMILILPTFEKHVWSENDLHLRSLMCREDGIVISSGFPKFRNLGETPREQLELSKSFVSGQLFLADKMDGSLIIRSVVDGHIILRTRGSHEIAPDMRESVMAYIIENHPKLLNANEFQHGSLLFEWTGPTNQIVLSYSESKLTLLAFMEHYDYLEETTLHTTNKLVPISQALGIPQARYWTPSELTLDEMVDNIYKDKNYEGCVATCFQDGNDIPFLVKIKTKWYLTLHRAAYNGPAETRSLIAKMKATDPDDLREKMMLSGMCDFEVATMISQKSKVFFDETAEAWQKFNEVGNIIAKRLTVINDRKTAALTIKDILVEEKASAGWIGIFLARHFGDEVNWDLGQRVVLSGLSSTYIRANVLNS